MTPEHEAVITNLRLLEMQRDELRDELQNTEHLIQRLREALANGMAQFNRGDLVKDMSRRNKPNYVILECHLSATKDSVFYKARRASSKHMVSYLQESALKRVKAAA